MRDVEPNTSGSHSHQILFPLAVGALFVIALFFGVLVG